MIQTLEPYSWCYAREFNLISGQKYIGFFRAYQRRSDYIYLFQVSLTDHTIGLEFSKLDLGPSDIFEGQCLFMNFENIADVDILLSEVPKHELALNYQKEINPRLCSLHNIVALDMIEYD